MHQPARHRAIRARTHALTGVLLILSTFADVIAARAGDAPGIITIGGPITETVYALGAGHQVIATDTSSLFPDATQALPKVGYQRALSVEGILSLRPDVVLASDESGPPPALEQLRRAGVRVERIAVARTREGALQMVRLVAQALGRREAGDVLVATMEQEWNQALAQTDGHGPHPRVVFLHARAPGALLIAGRETAAASLIELAGGTHAIDSFSGYRPLSAEALVAAAPDVILVSTMSHRALGGADAVVALPGVAATPAGARRRIAVVEDSHVLGFGPRTALAVEQLAAQFRADAKSR